MRRYRSCVALLLLLASTLLSVGCSTTRTSTAEHELQARFDRQWHTLVEELAATPPTKRDQTFWDEIAFRKGGLCDTFLTFVMGTDEVAEAMRRLTSVDIPLSTHRPIYHIVSLFGRYDSPEYDLAWLLASSSVLLPSDSAWHHWHLELNPSPTREYNDADDSIERSAEWNRNSVRLRRMAMHALARYLHGNTEVRKRYVRACIWRRPQMVEDLSYLRSCVEVLQRGVYLSTDGSLDNPYAWFFMVATTLAGQDHYFTNAAWDDQATAAVEFIAWYKKNASGIVLPPVPTSPLPDVETTDYTASESAYRSDVLMF